MLRTIFSSVDHHGSCVSQAQARERMRRDHCCCSARSCSENCALRYGYEPDYRSRGARISFTEPARRPRCFQGMALYRTKCSVPRWHDMQYYSYYSHKCAMYVLHKAVSQAKINCKIHGRIQVVVLSPAAGRAGRGLSLRGRACRMTTP